MLFSDDQVSAFINDRFEAAWVSLRPVPLVRIDFGNERTITRTLHGNIATYVCLPDGKVLDILPGIYEPKTYLEQLQRFTQLAGWIKAGDEPLEDRLKRYHIAEATAVTDGTPAFRFVPADMTKTLRIEGLLEGALAANLLNGDALSPTAPATGTLAESLIADTRVNESVRRLAIHHRLAEVGAVRTDQITKWLYREVLHADLDDPYLGLGETLFAGYPFEESS